MRVMDIMRVSLDVHFLFLIGLEHTFMGRPHDGHELLGWICRF
jgi:hypothetical protein